MATGTLKLFKRNYLYSIISISLAFCINPELYGSWWWGTEPAVDDPQYRCRWSFPGPPGKYYCGWKENGVDYLFQTETYAECSIDASCTLSEVVIHSEVSVSYDGVSYTFQCPVIGRVIDWKLWSGSVEDYQERYFQEYGSYGQIYASSPSLSYNCPIRRIVIDDGIMYVGPGAFLQCKCVQSIKLPRKLSRIENRTFEGCYALEDINLPDSIYYIGNSAFAGCSNLTSVTWPQSLRTIGNSAFAMDEFGYGCGLTSAILPEGVEHIGDYAFRGPWNGNGLVDVYIPDSCTNIGVCAFQYCRKLRNIRLPVNIKGLPKGLFDGCTSLETLEIPNSVKNIGDSAFSGCSRLTEVRLGSNILSIDSYAFYDCTSLEALEIPNSVNWVCS